MADRGKRSAFFRGSDGINRTDEELALAKQRAEQRKAEGNKPFRFYVPVGETRRIIVTDDKPDFFMYEHALKDAEGKWGRLFTGCVKTFDNCPVCESQGKESYYALFLSVIDLTPFTLRDGTEVEFSRKLLVVKPAQQKKFLRFFSKEGTLRGAMFDMTRDGDKDSSIGNDIEFVDFVDEDELASYTRSWKDKDGKKHNEDCGEPYVYEELFEEPTTEKLRAIVGGEPAPGSRRQAEREVGGGSRGRSASARGRSRDEDEEQPTRGRAGHTTRGAARKDADDWEDDKDGAPFDADEDEAPRSRTRPAAKASAPARGRGRTAEPEEDEDPKPARRGRTAPPDDDEEEERRPARGRGRTAEPEEEDEDPKPSRRTPPRTPAAATRPATRGRAAAKEEPEDEEEEDTRPFRAAARRGRR